MSFLQIHGFTEGLCIKPTDGTEIKNIVRELFSNKSPGHDDLSPKVVKAIIEHVLHYVTYLTSHLQQDVFQIL
jgi:hypothetical protein